LEVNHRLFANALAQIALFGLIGWGKILKERVKETRLTLKQAKWRFDWGFLSLIPIFIARLGLEVKDCCLWPN
jgi:hypothetical protein